MTTLNADQHAVSQSFLDFMLSDETYAAITGPAGTGKTYLMNYLSNHGLQMYEEACTLMAEKPVGYSVVFTATTNKAAEVLSQSLGKPVSTIHSFLGLKVSPNFRTGKVDLVKTNNFKVRRNYIVFIDEISTADTALVAYIKEAFLDSKIVFVGDHAQMSPVDEVLSEAFTMTDPAYLYRLDTPVRNADTPALMELCTQLRNTVETGIFKPIQRVEDVIEYLEPADMELGFSIIFAEPDPSCRVLCYTNERVKDYNAHIREEVRQLPHHFVPGEAVIIGDAFQRGATTLSVEQQMEIVSIERVSGDVFASTYAADIPSFYVTICHPGQQQYSEHHITAMIPEYPYDLKNALNRLKQRKEWREYYDLKGSYLDLRAKAACTVYKAQGSSYDFVFIDLGNIGTSFDAQQVARMLYVAVSRARYKVFLYGQLPNRYNDSKGAPLWNPENGPSLLPAASSNTIAAA